MKYDTMLETLHRDDWFQSFVKEELTPGCPDIIPYTPGMQRADWEYRSGMQTGYLLALSHFGVELND
jgi:hypothetical protein